MGKRGTGLCIAVLCLVLSGCRLFGPSESRPVIVEGPAVAKTEAAFNEAVGLAAQARYKQAGDQFAPLADDFRAIGHSDRAAECLFWAGFCAEKQGDAAGARAFYERAVRESPRAPAAQKAAERLAALRP